MKKIATRERILETVLPVFAKKGYHRVIVDAIVLEIGDGEILLPSSEHRAGSAQRGHRRRRRKPRPDGWPPNSKKGRGWETALERIEVLTREFETLDAQVRELESAQRIGGEVFFSDAFLCDEDQPNGRQRASATAPSPMTTLNHAFRWKEEKFTRERSPGRTR